MPNLQNLQERIDQIPSLLEMISTLQQQGSPDASPEAQTHFLKEINVLRSVVSTWKEETAHVLAEEFPQFTELRWKFDRHCSALVHTQTVLEDITRNLQNAKSDLEAIAAAVKKREDELQNNVWTLVHPFITNVARMTMDEGKYADAVDAACRAITGRIREMVEVRTGELLDGAALLQRAFSADNPVIRFDNSIIQEAYRQIFTGVLTAFGRNEDVTIEDAMRQLMVLSLLMEKLD